MISLIKPLLMDRLVVSNYFANINNTVMNITDIDFWELVQLVPVVDFGLDSLSIQVMLGGSIYSIVCAPTPIVVLADGKKDSKPQ